MFSDALKLPSLSYSLFILPCSLPQVERRRWWRGDYLTPSNTHRRGGAVQVAVLTDTYKIFTRRHALTARRQAHTDA